MWRVKLRNIVIRWLKALNHDKSTGQLGGLYGLRANFLKLKQILWLCALLMEVSSQNEGSNIILEFAEGII